MGRYGQQQQSEYFGMIYLLNPTKTINRQNDHLCSVYHSLIHIVLIQLNMQKSFSTCILYGSQV